MPLSLVEEAALFVVQVHQGQKRKGAGEPYFFHVFEAASVVALLTDAEETIAAALLHDTLEDTDTDQEEIARRFGPRVTALVLAESEQKRPDLPKEETWMLRKQETISHLKNTSDLAVKQIALGDKLSNMRGIYRGVQEEGNEFWQHFHQKEKQKHGWYYREILKALSDLEHTLPWKELNQLVQIVFQESNEKLESSVLQS